MPKLGWFSVRVFRSGIILCGVLAGCLPPVRAQRHKTENLIIVTLDGMRWQEVFGGADSALLHNPKYTRNIGELQKKFWREDAGQRRALLFPFIWQVMEASGQLYGNRNVGSLVDNANPYKISYPGYNELFTGYPDSLVRSNSKIPNKNTNVLEYIDQQEGYQGRVAAFSSWDASPYFLNKWRSGLYVNADQDSIDFGTATSVLIHDIQRLSMKPNGERLDVLTYIAAREYLKARRPKVLYISFDETDEFAHQGNYDAYLAAAHALDGMLADIWNTVQSLREYRGKTTLLVTCDHGRGDRIKDQWRDHGQRIEDAGQLWVAVMGPDSPPLGEVSVKTVLYQKQIAPTLAALLGLHFVPDRGEALPISTIIHP